MPGVLLRTFGLPAENYKSGSKKKEHDRRAVRHQILVGLKDRLCRGQCLVIENLNQIEEKCLANHDILDSLVAAAGAAMWAKEESQFIAPREFIPPSEETEAAQIEGWIYAPKEIFQG